MAIDWKHLSDYKTTYLIDLVGSFYQNLTMKTIKNYSRRKLIRMIREKQQ